MSFKKSLAFVAAIIICVLAFTGALKTQFLDETASATPVANEDGELISSIDEIDSEDVIQDQPPARNTIELEWYREHLGSQEKKDLYDLIEAAGWSLQEGIVVDHLSIDDVDECYWAVVYDHPEMFWLDNSYRYTYIEDEVTSFSFDYLLDDKAEIESKLRDIDMITDAIIDGTQRPKLRDMKIRNIYEWISGVCDFEGGNRDQSLISVFEDRESVCAGYTQALAFMIKRAGIPCVRIGGYAYSEDGGLDDRAGHAWLVVADWGELKYYDITWDDRADWGELTKYYALSKEQIDETHVVTSAYAPGYGGKTEREEAVEMEEMAVNLSTGKHLTMPGHED